MCIPRLKLEIPSEGTLCGFCRHPRVTGKYKAVNLEAAYHFNISLVYVISGAATILILDLISSRCKLLIHK